MTHQEYKYERALFYASPKNRVAVCPDHTRLIQRCVSTRHGVARFEAFSCPGDITFQATAPCPLRRPYGAGDGINRRETPNITPPLKTLTKGAMAKGLNWYVV